MRSLSYAAKDGVIKVHCDSSAGFEGLLPLLEEAIAMSDGCAQRLSGRADAVLSSKIGSDLAQRWVECHDFEYCLLDTFFSDSVNANVTHKVFRRSAKYGRLTRLLFVDPFSKFARARAESIGQDCMHESVRGLRLVGQTLEDLRLDLRMPPAPNRGSLSSTSVTEIAEAVQGLTHGLPVQLRFYSEVASGPLYIFSDIMLVGRFGPGRSSIHQPWWMIVNDQFEHDDLFDAHKGEFDKIWGTATTQPVPDPERRGQHLVFVSHAEHDRTLALEIRESLRGSGIEVFVAAASVEAGSDWSEAIRNALNRAAALVVILTKSSAESSWVMGEVAAAWVLGTPVIPAVVGVDYGRLPAYLTRYQGIDISTPQGIKQLSDRVLVQFGTTKSNRDARP